MRDELQNYLEFIKKKKRKRNSNYRKERPEKSHCGGNFEFVTFLRRLYASFVLVYFPSPAAAVIRTIFFFFLTNKKHVIKLKLIIKDAISSGSG